MNEEEIRETVRRALEEAGDSHLGPLTRKTSSMLQEVSVPLPKTWRFFRFDTVPHPQASFQVAVEVSTGKVVYLTGRPEAFGQVLRASKATLPTTREAVAVARAYLDVTRRMNRYLRVVDGVEDLTWRPEPTDEEKKARERAEPRLRSLLKPPAAVAKGDAYVVTLFVRNGTDIEQRTVSIDAGASVTDTRQVVLRGLPLA
ncbi:hypothetical protein [Actinomadura sp. NBRC 104425]|uniref:hypothetical protein n=1 Tax=Actinomadura sp. NBRC 104425 TaxID=3032204 RepID=UPI002557A2B6|nr:hypothetical protein [Actinomadura sp. NBRC 104425]